MSNFPFVNPHSPQNRKNALAAQGLVSPQTHLIGLPPSTKGVHKQSNSNQYAHKHIQPPPWGENIDLKQRDVSPLRHNPQEDRHAIPAQYNFQNVITQKRDSIGLANVRSEKSPHQVRLSRDISPIGRLNMHNEGVDFSSHVGRREDRGVKGGERDNSWNKLINRPQEQALARNQKIFEWKRVLDDQVIERQKKKHQEEEKRKNEEVEAEERYQRQIDELSSEIHKRKKTLHKNGLLRQQSNVLPITNASPISRPNPNLNNINAKPHKELRLNRENLSQINNPSPIPMNHVRERRGKSHHREESFLLVNHSADKQDYKPRNDLNQYIDNMKAEILQGQEVFRNHMKDLKDEAYKLGKFRNLAERNLLGAQRVGFIKGGAASMPSNLVFKEAYGEDGMVTPVTLVESAHKPRKIKISMQEEEKFKWETDDFYSKLPATKNKNKQLLSGVQEMVKIEPVTDQLMAYKKPKSPQKKWFEDEESRPEKQEPGKGKKETRNVAQEKADEEKTLPKEIKDNEDKLKSGGFKKINSSTLMKENKIISTPIKKAEEESKAISSITSILEIKSIPKISSEPAKKLEEEDHQLRKSSSQKETESQPGTQITITASKNGEKTTQEDYLQITKNFQQPLAVMLKESAGIPNDRDITPSIDQQGSRRNPKGSENIPSEKASEKGTIILNTNEDVTEREVPKAKDPIPVQKESKISGHKNKQTKNLGLKSEVALKALSKFVSKDGLEAKIAGDKNLQSDPLARLDYMIDYLFNYNP